MSKVWLNFISHAEGGVPPLIDTSPAAPKTSCFLCEEGARWAIRVRLYGSEEIEGPLNLCSEHHRQMRVALCHEFGDIPVPSRWRTFGKTPQKGGFRS